jgi:enediyne polyketide synthase
MPAPAGTEQPASVSFSHCGAATLAIVGDGPLGCDMEMVSPRTRRSWRDLLGEERFGLAEAVAVEAREDFDAAATRVWAVGESVKKAGAAPSQPVVLSEVRADGRVLFSAGRLTAATFAAATRNRAVIAIALERNRESLRVSAHSGV